MNKSLLWHKAVKSTLRVIPMYVLFKKKKNHNFLSELQYYLYTCNKPVSVLPSSFDVLSLYDRL